MRHKHTAAGEQGMVLVAALLALMLISALMAGMFAAVTADQRGAAIDRDQTQAYAAAHAGLEQMTSGLASLFVTDVSPSVSDINAIAANPPAIPGFEFRAPGGAANSGFTITYTDANSDGVPDALANADITTGPYTGFKGLITPYTMTVTARSTSGGAEVRLRRGLQTVAIPVFQFGIFSDTDLTIYAGGGFAFGGRVHTNGSLFVAAQTSGTNNITFNDRITAVNEVVRLFLANGLNTTTSAPTFTNDVMVPTSASTSRNLNYNPNEGSVTGMPGSAANANWTTLSTGTYKSYIRTGLTGAKRLDLPLVSQGASPIDLIRRPPLNENTVRPLVFGQRYFAMASLRILLSDRIADITTLPTVTATAPVWLGADAGTPLWNSTPPVGYGPVDATHPPIARSMGAFSTTTNASSVYSGGLSQIYVAAIPAVFTLQNMTIKGNTGATFPITCQGKTGSTSVASASGGNTAIPANQFFGCNISAVLGAGPYNNTPYTVTGVVGGATVSVTPTAVTATAITVAADATARFSPNQFWMNNPSASVANTSVPISCEGYTTVFAAGGITSNNARFLNCRGLSAAIGNNQVVTTSALADQNTGLIGGYIKIEKQDSNGVWTDVTMELLNLGIGATNLAGTICADPTPNAVLRIQRLRDNAGGTCTYSQSQSSYDWWPQGLYDPREGSFRDAGTIAGMQTSPMLMSGVMQYIALDVANLKKWLAGTTGTTGTQAWNQNGYIIYFSDRRGNHDPAGTVVDQETGEFGYEDNVNSTSATGAPDGVLQNGEDVNGNGTQQLYGQIPWNNAANIPSGALAPYTFAAARPTTQIPISNAAGVTGAGAARVNKNILFRRALKLVNGAIVGGVNNLPTSGLTVTSENPIYVQGDYNGTSATLPADATWTNQEPNRPAAVIGDAITLLSNNWNDARSFEVPNQLSSRNATSTVFRFAALAGKGPSFAYCAAACGSPGQLFGTDGGVANFLRMVEDWGGDTTYYRGSMVSLAINRQATGTFKFHSTTNHIYNAGGRAFSFDIDFLTPTLLPPGTPMFRDVNTLQFRQILRPNQ